MTQSRKDAWLVGWAQDLRVAARQFRRAPGFVATTVLVLMLGLGGATAIFSVVRGVLLRPLPYPNPDRIVQAWEVSGAGTRMNFSDPNFDDVRARAHGLTALTQIADYGTVSVSGDITPVRASLAAVSHDFLTVLGVSPIMGRSFAPDEEVQGGTPVAVVSWRFWRRVMGGTHDALGKRLTVGDQTYTVVGVMDPRVDFPAGTDLWISRGLLEHLPSRTAHNWRVIARLAGGFTLATARREATALAHSLAGQYGSQTMMANVAIVPLRDQMVATARPTLLVLLAASIVLLLTAWANVGNLLIARLTTRRGELAVRLALGAPPTRLIRQCLAESLLLTSLGGVLGIVLADFATRGILAIDPTRLPRAADVHLDLVVFLFALGVTLGTAAALALLASWRVTRGNVRELLSLSGRTISASGGTARLRQLLVTAQVATTVVLLVAAGLLGRSFTALLSVDPGFHTDHAIVLDVAIDAEDSASKLKRAQFYHELLTQLGTLPGVTQLGATNGFPFEDSNGADGTFIVLTSPDEKVTFDNIEQLFHDPARTGDAAFRDVSGSYFGAMHIPLLEGRTFDDRDGTGAANVAVVSASLAKARWPGQSPIGKWVEFGNMDGDLQPFMIVGVVGDIREASLDAAPRPTFYANYAQRPIPEQMFVVLDGARAAAAITAGAQSIVRALRPNVPPRVQTMSDIVATSLAGRRLALVLVGAFGAAALLLSACGLYGIISYFVTQRAQELTIRIALGASRRAIIALVLREGTVLTVAGLVVGAVAALAATRVLARLLYGVGVADPIAFGSMILLVGVVALAASWIPAYRAARADALEVLRAG